MYNFETSSWDLISESQTTPTDSFVDANVWSNAGRYVEPGSGQLRTRIQYNTDGITLSWRWLVEIDQAVWKVLR